MKCYDGDDDADVDEVLLILNDIHLKGGRRMPSRTGNVSRSSSSAKSGSSIMTIRIMMRRRIMRIMRMRRRRRIMMRRVMIMRRRMSHWLRRSWVWYPGCCCCCCGCSQNHCHLTEMQREPRYSCLQMEI